MAVPAPCPPPHACQCGSPGTGLMRVADEGDQRLGRGRGRRGADFGTMDPHFWGLAVGVTPTSPPLVGHAGGEWSQRMVSAMPHAG